MSQGSQRGDAGNHNQSCLVNHILREWSLMGREIYSPQTTHWSACHLPCQGHGSPGLRTWRPEQRSEQYWAGAGSVERALLSFCLGRKDHLLCISGRCTFCLSPLCEKFRYDEASALEMLTCASSCFWSFENKVFARDVTVGRTPPPWYSPGCEGHFPYTPAGIMTFPGQEPEAHRTTLPRSSTV